MAEEYQESDIIFSEQLRQPEDDPTHRRDSCSRKKKTAASSLPVSIPGNVSRFVELSGGEDEMEFDDGERTPPHLMVGRRIAGKIAFSVCAGNGRTLKGRDLSHVRNSILRLTGFLET